MASTADACRPIFHIPSPLPLDLPVRVKDLDGEDEPLSLMMQEMSRALDADGVLVTWCDASGEPAILFAGGACETQPMLGSMVAGLARDADGSAGSATRWQVLDGSMPGGLLTTSIPAGSGVVTIANLFRRIGDGTRVRARDTVARLLPLVQPFFRLWAARARTLTSVRGLLAAVNKTDVGILIVDGDGRLTFANAAAEVMLAERDGLRRTAGMPGATRLTDTLRLQAAIEHVIADPDPHRGGGAPAPVVALHRRDRRPLMAAVVPNEPGRPGEGAGGAVIYVFDPDQDLRPLIEPACKLYGLSPVETRLTCQLADGATIADAAARMHIREQTARSYLKQVFMKTGTKRQAELVWLMLRSSVRTAPGCRTNFV